jgi:hypothetical protein
MKAFTMMLVAFFILTLHLLEHGNIFGEVSEGDNQSHSLKSGKQSELTPLLGDRQLNGEEMKAFLVAHEAFKKEPGIPPGKKLIENYNIQLQLEKDGYGVKFIPKHSPGEESTRGGETSLGKEVSFIISKNYKFVKRFFYK